MLIPLKKIDRNREDVQILAPIRHIQQVPSKNHVNLIHSLNHWLNVPKDKLQVIEEFMQMIHTSSLIMDDLQDDSKFRYGVPVAHCIYSFGLTLNAFSHNLFLAHQKIMPLGMKAIKIYLDAVIEGHRGQGIDLYWRDNFVCPSEDEYMDMIKQKSSFYFLMAYDLMKLFSDSETDCWNLAYLIGIYYQLRDDYCNLSTEKHAENKSYCSDITEGNVSLPIIHAVKNSENGVKILSIMRKRTQDLDIKKYCRSILQEAGSIEYTKKVLVELEKQIYDEIKQLGGNPLLTDTMDNLSILGENIYNVVS